MMMYEPVGHRERISLVTIDDQADLRRLYRLALRDTEFDVVGEAADGREGVKVIEATKPVLALLDLSMPNMDGLETLVALRQAAPQTRIVVLSGFTRERLGPIAEELGAVDYVEKGARPAELIERLRAAVRAPMPKGPPPRMERIRELQQRMSELI